MITSKPKWFYQSNAIGYCQPQILQLNPWANHYFGFSSSKPLPHLAFSFMYFLIDWMNASGYSTADISSRLPWPSEVNLETKITNFPWFEDMSFHTQVMRRKVSSPAVKPCGAGPTHVISKVTSSNVPLGPLDLHSTPGWLGMTGWVMGGSLSVPVVLWKSYEIMTLPYGHCSFVAILNLKGAGVCDLGSSCGIFSWPKSCVYMVFAALCSPNPLYLPGRLHHLKANIDFTPAVSRMFNSEFVVWKWTKHVEPKFSF